MTQSEQRHKEIMKIIVIMLNGRRPTRPERKRLAELTGFYISGRGSMSKDKRHLPRMTDADFATPESMKRLCERIMGRPVLVTPEPLRKKGRPKGSCDNRVHDRKISTAEKAQRGGRPALVSEKLDVYHRQDADGYDHVNRMIARDIQEGKAILHKNEEVRNKADEYREIAINIAHSLRNLYKKHTTK